MGIISVMGRMGDEKIRWDLHDELAVARARRQFDDLLRQGFTAFSLSPGDKQGERINVFDPEIGQIVMVPRVAGG